MDNLKMLRDRCHIKQDEMARYLGISPPTYSKKESGDIRFSLIEAKKIADYFQLSIEEIFFNN